MKTIEKIFDQWRLQQPVSREFFTPDCKVDIHDIDLPIEEWIDLPNELDTIEDLSVIAVLNDGEWESLFCDFLDTITGLRVRCCWLAKMDGELISKFIITYMNYHDFAAD